VISRSGAQGHDGSYVIACPFLTVALALTSIPARLINFTQMGGQVGFGDKTTRKYVAVLEQLFSFVRVTSKNAGSCADILFVGVNSILAERDPAIISPAPHYGLRYGFASATGNFQRLRGRPPLVSPLKSCMSRSFTAITRVRIPSGTPNLFSNLRRFLFSRRGHVGDTSFSTTSASRNRRQATTLFCAVRFAVVTA